MLHRVGEHDKIWDIVIIGGGATGLGCAVDAASRGYDVLLVEQSDFGKGTSSRSTKLVHGGVRYLAQGNVSLVRESLRERALLLKNAPHLVRKQEFVVPVYSYWDRFFYGAGLKTYNMLSGRRGFGKSRILSKDETIKRLPNVKLEGLNGGILYFDGQFDDARLLVNLAQTAAEQGAVLLNHARVFSLQRDKAGRITGAAVSDEITGQVFPATARVVINATGAFCDVVRQFSNRNAEALIAPSQGIHLVVGREFLPGGSALMVPKTADERVLFAIPWHDRALLGTTDTPIEKATLEPRALEEEIDFILATAADYMEKPPTRADVQSVFAGIRPLVKAEKTQNTATLARDHTIETDANGLVTITGGKWTTYRKMATDAVDHAVALAGLEYRRSETDKLRIHGAGESSGTDEIRRVYGSDASSIAKMIVDDPSLGELLNPRLPYTRAEVLWAVREEMAETVEDVLARRTRALFLDAKAAIETAPVVAEIMAAENGRDAAWIKTQLQQFRETAAGYSI